MRKLPPENDGDSDASGGTSAMTVARTEDPMKQNKEQRTDNIP